MVIINDSETSNQKNYNFDFELDQFQRHAIESINNNHHTLITAHTGSGKTIPAEYAIEKFVSEGKRVIYTSPIKSLSNQKYNDFVNKFPKISFGLITGDIKCNPCAQCLIMTTEILRNSLFEYKMSEKTHNMFEMDYNSELGCIIYDEIHYINDEDRGRVWEESIMLNPPDCLLVMLSATISKIEAFAQWIETTTQTVVEICPTDKRVVPLEHYHYICAPESAIIRMKEDNNQSLKNKLDTFLHLKTLNTKFNDTSYYTIGHFLSSVKSSNSFVKPSFVLHSLLTKLNAENMLPAICFVFSRKMVERYANMVKIPLIDNAHEVETTTLQLLKTIPNYKDYIETREFKNLMTLLKRGVAIHHSGLIPVIKEIIELLFAKGFIKILFATETFAVGVNMPTKTVLFADIQKMSNTGKYRNLHPQEYTQMAGRAGRRGLDKIGYVIHLSNLFNDIPSHNEYKHIVSGKPQEIISKFKLHNNLILRLISSNKDLIEFTKSSMIKYEFDKKVYAQNEILDKMNKTYTPIELTGELEEYHNIFSEYNTIGHSSKGKKMYKRMSNMIKINPNLERHHKKYISSVNKNYNIRRMKNMIVDTKNYIDDTIYIIGEELKKDKFILDSMTLSPLGISATHIQEGHSLILSELLFNKVFQALNVQDITSVLSTFTPIRSSCNITTSEFANEEYVKCLTFIQDRNIYYKNKDTKYMLDIGEDYTFQLNLCAIMNIWTQHNDCETLNRCVASLSDNGIFIGEFIKAVLKINAVAKELSSVCELHNLIELKQKLDNIQEATMKHVVTNFSLYV